MSAGDSIRAGVKSVAEAALIWSGFAAMHRGRMSDQTLVLAYHNIVPDSLGARGDIPNHLPVSAFAAQLDALIETHDVVALSDTLASRPSKRPRAAITFDDAYRGAVVHGIAEVTKRELPATIFVAPGLLGGRAFWWDRLAQPGGLSPDVRTQALDTLSGEGDRIEEWAARAGLHLSDVPEDLRSATEDELLRVAEHRGITLGAHTWTHPNLSRLPVEQRRAELTRPLQWLREHVASPLLSIAYPYGYFTTDVARHAAEVGYSSGFAVSGGWLAPPPTDPFAIPRVNIPRGISARGFALRGAGLLAG